MIILFLYGGIIAAIIGFLTLFSINLWDYYISILSIVIIFSEGSWVRVYKNKADAILSLKKPGLFEFNMSEQIALKYAPSIILPRVEHGFRTMEISACSGWIQVLLPINIVAALLYSNYFIIVILIPLFLLSLLLYAHKLPAADIDEDLKRINYLIPRNEVGDSFDFSVDEYKKLIEKIRSSIDVAGKVKVPR